MARLGHELWQLTKPGVTRMCVLTTLGGIALAPGSVSLSEALSVLLGSALAVGGANAFNMWWERGPDRQMTRTRRRPLPSGRLAPAVALRFAWVLTVLSIAVLLVGTNGLTALLAALATGGYVLIYTPMKYRSPMALVIGAVPGAVPPLLGWTSVTDSIDAPALVLFGILLVWQIPHFLAIAMYRQEDYARAGIKVVPLVRGVPIAKIQAVAWSMLLFPLSLLLVPMGVAGDIYTVCAGLLSAGFLAWSFTGLDDAAGARWARGFFFASLVYLPALTGALIVDRLWLT